MRRTLGAFLLVVLLSAGVVAALSACGQSTQDEFVGTWHRSDYERPDGWKPPLVITKTSDGYQGSIVYSNGRPEFDLKRDGDTLKGKAKGARGDLVDLEIVYQPQSGHITLRGAAFPGASVSETDWVRTSTSTDAETASPL